MKNLRDMTAAELESLMRRLADRVSDTFEDFEVEKPLYALLAFDDLQHAQFVSNVMDRKSMAGALRECAGRLERHEGISPPPPKGETPPPVGEGE